MVATSAYHVARMTVRVSVVTMHRDIDVTVPTSSTLAEILPELARLIDLPDIHRPWQASTVGGAPLDMHTPLHKLRLFDGSIINLHPQEPPSPPAVRDAAEALGRTADGVADTVNLAAAAGLTGAVCVAILTGGALGASLSVALCACAGVLASLAWATRSRALFGLVPACAAAAAGVWVAGPSPTWVDSTEPALGVLAGGLAAGVCLGAGAALRLVGPRTAAIYLGVSAIAAVAAIGAWLPAPDAPAALAVLAGVITVTVTPALASRAAGLAIPRIPTAGEELSGSDGYQSDVDARCANAVANADALCVAAALGIVPGLAVLAYGGGAWVEAFALCTAGAVGIHALRHRYPTSRAALGFAALAAVVAASVAAMRTHEAHPAMLVIAALAACGVGTAPLWRRSVADLEPTTVVWFERAEMASLIAIIPLAVQLTGFFAMVRGL